MYPNSLAFAILMAWPIVTLALFRKLPPGRAFLATMVAGYLILPEPPASFDFPLAPPLTKHNIPAFSAFLCMMFMYGKRGPLLPESLYGKSLVTIFVLSPVFTAFTNMEPVFYGQVGLPGLGIKDAIALSIQQFLLIIPFLLARQYLADRQSQRDILIALLIGGVFYSLLMLIEIRMSPQLNMWIYGYFQHFFSQTVRFGGWRPVVFLYHGLWVAFYCMTAVVAAWALWRRDDKLPKVRMFLLALYLTAVLILAKSLGAVLFAMILIPMAVIFTPKTQVKMALLIGTLAVAYPVLKGAHLIPEKALLAQAEAIDQDRSASLQFRFDNENILLDRAYAKPVFGWGSWGRNHILDPVTGNILTVTDGRWIITIGVYGWIGFLAEFGLLLYPIMLIFLESIAFRRGTLTPYIGPLAALLAINIVDLIPNATLTPLTWIIAGALVGYAEQLKYQRSSEGPRIEMDWKPIL